MARERRHTRRRRRRGRFGFLYKLLSVLAVAAAVAVACVVFFRISEVSVEGSRRYTPEEIIAASGIQTGDNLIALSESQVASRIRTQLPYVEGVSIQRLLPDGVRITVTERAAAASVDSSAGRWLISSQGKLLEQSDSADVMAVTGLTASAPYAGGMLQTEEEGQNTLTFVLALLTELEERELLSQCTALDCTAASSMTLTYGIYEVKLPRTADYSKYLSLLLGALDSGQIPEGQPGVCDLTVAEGKLFFQPSH